MMSGKKKWLKVIKNDFMSSEVSGDDDNIIVHPLQWRSRIVNEMFSRICNKKSPQAIEQKHYAVLAIFHGILDLLMCLM